MSTRLLRRHALAIFKAGLAAADPADAVTRHLERIDFSRYPNIYVIGAGKAGASMGRAAERVLGRRITAGLINVKDGHTAKLRRIELNECGHPVPDGRGVAGASRIAEMAAAAGPRDLVLCLISGGASALLPLPAASITLEEMQALTRLLLACGADIHELNAVRKHISRIKGGQLARLAAPARVEALLLSDVIGDDLDTIGSGPTAPDQSTFAGAAGILEKYQLGDRVPASIRERLGAGVRGEIDETPKASDPLFDKVRNSIVGSNRLALAAAERHARGLGYRTSVLSSSIEGETREIARMHAAIARDAKARTCIITGGETTVTLRGSGLGGRNQEFVLAAAIDIAGVAETVVLSAGTDGSDGPTDAAGAIADGETLRRNPEASRYLAANDSYHYFESLGDLIVTGPTNTNVMDIHVILVGSR
ncbi:MAG TPA: glycerate kinase [Candidatus Sulfopaludibacter sp.]|jgi:hydroxypyruvate reductase|nr:glycerate kinase [Candidatus Sulfopaludibacter sp.]